MLREATFFCSYLTQRTGNNSFSVKDREKDGMGWRVAWGGGGVVVVDYCGYQSERTSKGRLTCTHTPGSFSPLCIVVRERALKRGQMLFYLSVVLLDCRCSL